MKNRHYSPQISRPLVGALYHEAKARGVTMTSLVNELLTLALQSTSTFTLAERAHGFQRPKRVDRANHLQLKEVTEKAIGDVKKI